MPSSQLASLEKIGKLKSESPALALAALRCHGYRSESRYLVFQCLEHTLAFESKDWRVLDEAHRKRNVAEYEGEIDIDDSLVEALIRAAKEIEKRVRALKPLV